MQNLYLYDDSDDVHELEPFLTWQENFIFWLKKYLHNKSSVLSSRFVYDENEINLNSMIKELESCNNIYELKDKVNSISRIGLKGLKSYFIAIYRFYLFMEKMEAHSIKEISTKSLRVFARNFLVEFSDDSVQNIKPKELSNATKKNTLVRIKNFLKFIEARNLDKTSDSHYDFSIKGDLRDYLGKMTKDKIEILNPDTEYIQFYKAIDEIQFKHCNTKYKLALKILMLTGIRVSELTGLTSDKIKEEKSSIVFEIIGKGNKTRTVFIQKSDIKSLWESFKKESNNFKNNFKNYIFLNQDGSKKLNDRIIGWRVEELLKFTGIKTTKKSAHLLRHSVLSYMYHNKAHSLEEIKTLAGHENMSTTQIYVHVAESYSQTTAKTLSSQIKKSLKK